MSVARSVRAARTYGAAAMVLVGEAAAQSTSSSAVAAAPASPMAGVVQSLVGLVIVVAAIYGVAWLIKRVGPRARSAGIVQVLGGASVGPREKVVVVRFGGETLLLGVAPGQVSLLQSVAQVDLPTTDSAADSSPAPRFVDRLRAARSTARTPS